MQKLIIVVKDRKGAGYISTVILVLVSMMVLAVAISSFSLLATQLKLTRFANEMVGIATVCGGITPEVAERYNELSEETGLSPSVSWSADWLDESAKTVQLSDTISVTLEMDTEIDGLGDAVNIPVNLKIRRSGLSQRYYKP